MTVDVRNVAPLNPEVQPQGMRQIAANRVGLLSGQAGSIATAANTTETTLFSFVLPGGSLKNVGDQVEVFAFGKTGATANNKTIIGYFGAASFTTGAVAGNNVAWAVRMRIVKDGANTQSIYASGSIGSTVVTATWQAGTEKDGNDILIKVTGTNGTAAASDILGKAMQVEFAG